jgi:hypothetical protein
MTLRTHTITGIFIEESRMRVWSSGFRVQGSGKDRGTRGKDEGMRA